MEVFPLTMHHNKQRIHIMELWLLITTGQKMSLDNILSLILQAQAVSFYTVCWVGVLSDWSTQTDSVGSWKGAAASSAGNCPQYGGLIFHLPHSLKCTVQRVSSGVGWESNQRIEVESNPPVTGPPDLDTKAQYKLRGPWFPHQASNPWKSVS